MIVLKYGNQDDFIKRTGVSQSVISNVILCEPLFEIISFLGAMVFLD